MVDRLPEELQDMISTEYRQGLRARRGEYLQRSNRTLLEFIHALCQDASPAVLDWMADLLQHPTIKPQRGGIVLVGPQGCGKSTFAALVALLLGRENVWETQTLRDRFNGHLEGVTLVHLSEVRVTNELSATYDLLSSPTITINRRYQNPYTIPSSHRILVTTNVLSPLPQHSHAFQRRFTVVHCGVVQDTVHEAIHDPAVISNFRQHLMERRVNI